jgi:tRNA pseudouridine55 synthase
MMSAEVERGSTGTRGAAIDGVLVVDKPEGMTSHDVVAVARRALREKRIGHTGTLDPLATGVLPLACGRATRLVRFLTASDKQYVATIRLGLTTDTYDITGTTVATSDARPGRDELVSALSGLTGEYLQAPPAFSAKKIGGTRAYMLARQEAPVALEAVPVRVSQADLVSVHADDVTVTITCSAGFYVRSFAHELGRRVGSGACLSALRRTRSGDFSLDQAATVVELQAGHAAARLIPLAALLPGFPAATLTDEGYRRVCHGRELEGAHARFDEGVALTPGRWVRLVAADGRLMAVGQTLPRPGALHPSVVLV